MFSVVGTHAFLVVWTGSKVVVFPLEQFQLEHGQTMFSEQIAP